MNFRLGSGNFALGLLLSIIIRLNNRVGLFLMGVLLRIITILNNMVGSLLLGGLITISHLKIRIGRLHFIFCTYILFFLHIFTLLHYIR
jgi:hypothetical protein